MQRRKQKKAKMSELEVHLRHKTTDFLDIFIIKKKKKNSKYLCNDMFDQILSFETTYKNERINIYMVVSCDQGA